MISFAAVLFVLGRIIFGGYFLLGGIDHFRNRAHLAGYVASKKVPMPLVAVVGSGILMVLGGAAIIANFYAILGMWLLVIFLVPTTFIMHPYWKETDPMARMSNRINFMKNLGLIGALLIMIAI